MPHTRHVHATPEQVSAMKTRSPDYLAFLYGKEAYRQKQNPQAVEVRVRKLWNKTPAGITLEELMKSAREGYAAARSVDTARASGHGKGRARAGASQPSVQTVVTTSRASHVEMPGLPGRRGTRHTHPAGPRPCPKCGV